jgi:hypothetical protein
VDYPTALILLGAIAVMLVVLGFWQYVSASETEFQRCVTTMDRIHAGMPAAKAVALMDLARPDLAPFPAAPVGHPNWGSVTGPVWSLYCSYVSPCASWSSSAQPSLALAPGCILRALLQARSGNFILYQFSEADGRIDATFRWDCYEHPSDLPSEVECLHPP